MDTNNIDNIKGIVEENNIIFLTYGEFISQSLISGLTESLEIETNHNKVNLSVSNNVFIVFIELSQNIMNYAKNKDNLEKPEGVIVVKKDDENYYIYSQNIVATKDMVKIEPRLVDIQSLNKENLKKKYRELRKQSKDPESKGGGIGFYEIAKRCKKINYKFTKISDDVYNFYFESIIENKTKQKEL